MTYTARLKVSCDNKDLLSKLSYTLLNTTTQKVMEEKLVRMVVPKSIIAIN